MIKDKRHIILTFAGERVSVWQSSTLTVLWHKLIYSEKCVIMNTRKDFVRCAAYGRKFEAGQGVIPQNKGYGQK